MMIRSLREAAVVAAVATWLLAAGCATPAGDRQAEAARAAAQARAEAEARARLESDSRSQQRAEAERAMAEAEARRAAAQQEAPPPPPPPPPPAGVEPEDRGPATSKNPNVASGREFDQVRVYFATDRQMAASDDIAFTGERGEGITYGYLYVSIPHDHTVGAIERPSLWKLEFEEDARHHMVIMRRYVDDRDGFMESVRRTLENGSDASFVFVHGYNVSFDDAARRTAQITYDLNFRGAPVFYSWPSQASLQGYTIDENNVQWSETNLKAFLLDYARNSGARDIYLIAHSMGNRALTGAVKALFLEHPEIRGRFKEIILTAPDIDAGIFKRDIAPALAAGCDKITLYVSNGDKALLASKKVHGYARAGDAADGIVTVPGIETVDASGLDTSFLEHSYFAESGSVLLDIRRLLLEGLRAAQRGLAERQQAAGRYWKFEPPKAP